jgi:hypothetical protein
MGIHTKRYHPELHYMRGPGPKWHEKNGTSPSPPPPRRRFELPHSSWVVAGATVILVVAVTALALA